MLHREAEEQLTQLMRLGERIEAATARAQQQLGRPPLAAELAAAAGRELATLQRLGAAGGPAAAAALAQHAPANAAVLPAWTAAPAAAAGLSEPTPQPGAASAGGGLALPAPAAEGQPCNGAGGGRRGRKASDPAIAAADAARRLAVAVATGRRARRILGDSQLRLVVRIASRYQHSASVALEDLVQARLVTPPRSTSCPLYTVAPLHAC
jgi:hypothetical protein